MSGLALAYVLAPKQVWNFHFSRMQSAIAFGGLYVTMNFAILTLIFCYLAQFDNWKKPTPIVIHDQHGIAEQDVEVETSLLTS